MMVAYLHPWISRWPRGSYPGTVEYTLQTGAVIEGPGTIVVKDGNDEVTEIANATPSEILGFTVEDDSDSLVPGKVLVIEATGTTIFAMSGTITPTAAHVGQEYGIGQDANGAWYLDLGVTGADARMAVSAVSILRELFFCTVMAAFRQA